MSHVAPDAGPADLFFGQSFQSLVSSFAHAIPKVFLFVLVLVAGWLVALAVRSVVRDLLRPLSFGGIGASGTIGGAISRIAGYLILLVVLQVAAGALSPNPVSRQFTGIIAWLPGAAVAVVLVVLAFALASLVRDLVRAAAGRSSYGRFAASAGQAFVAGLGIIAALTQIGIASAVAMPVMIALLGPVAVLAAIAVGAGSCLIRPAQGARRRSSGTTDRVTSTHPAAGEELERLISKPASPGGGTRY